MKKLQSARSANLRRFAFGVASFLFLQATSVAQQDMFFDSDGVRIRYLEAGKGPPVVLVHGQGSSADGNEWGTSGVFSALARDYRVIAFDMRGHGRSAKPRDPKLYGPEMGMDIVRLLDHLRIQKADVVGYSLGTMVVATALARHPERFSSAVFGGAAPYLAYDQKTQELDDREADEREKDGISRTMLQRLSPPGTVITEEEFRRRSAAALADPTQDRFAVAAQVRARRTLVVPSATAATLPMPVLGVVGSADPAKVLLDVFAKVHPRMKLVVIEGATHAVQNGPAQSAAYNRPEFLAAIREFLSAQRQ